MSVDPGPPITDCGMMELLELEDVAGDWLREGSQLGEEGEAMGERATKCWGCIPDDEDFW